MDTFWQDVKFGLRMLAKSPGIMLAAVITLALGISVNTATFSFANTYVLRDPNFQEPERLVHLWETNRRHGFNRSRVSLPNFLDWKRQSRSFTDLGVFNYTEENLVGPDGPERVYAGRVSANIFDLLGVQPVLGRGFLPDEDRPGRGRVAVLSHRFWELRYAADPNVLGRVINLNDEPYEIVGVMPADFAFPLPITQLWVPRELNVELYPREQRFLQVAARLKPGVTREQAQAEMETVARRLEAEHPQTNADAGVNVTPLKNELNFGYDIFLVMSGLMGVAGGFLLLIACANVASLMLSRGLGRTREFAIRAALGAGRGRVVRQLLVENLLVSLVGGVLGGLLAESILRSAAGMIPPDLYHVGELGLDTATLAFVAGLCAVVTLLFGLAPAMQCSKPNLTEALKEGGTGAGVGLRRQRLQGGLVVAQVGMSLVLLIGAALIMQSFAQLRQVNLGFETDSVLTMKLVLPGTRYASDEQRANFQRRMVEEARTVPGVVSAATVNYLPLNHESSSTEFHVEGQAEDPSAKPPAATTLWVTPDYFDVMRIPLRRGRAFTEQDDAGARPAVIVSEALASKFFPEADPIGRRLLLREDSGEDLPAEIVGVVGNVKHWELEEEAPLQIYRPQMQEPWRYMRLVVRAGTSPTALVGGLRAAVARVDATLPVTEVRTMDEVVSEYLLPRRVMMVSLAVVALGALLLAAVGLFGVLAHSVAQRTREMGIRMALGAQRGAIVRLVIGQGLKLVLVGTGLGLGGALAMSRVMAGLLYGVSATDAPTYIATPLALLLVALVACWIPARRAARVEPMVGLRYE